MLRENNIIAENFFGKKNNSLGGLNYQEMPVNYIYTKENIMVWNQLMNQQIALIKKACRFLNISRRIR